MGGDETTTTGPGDATTTAGSDDATTTASDDATTTVNPGDVTTTATDDVTTTPEDLTTTAQAADKGACRAVFGELQSLLHILKDDPMGVYKSLKKNILDKDEIVVDYMEDVSK